MGYELHTMHDLLKGNSYAGRGIVVGKARDGAALIAYFIMGRSANSRNRIFVEKQGELFTEPYDSEKVENPGLIIYAAIRRFQNHIIVTNGDQTDTIYESLCQGKGFAEALETRCFEPDAPNFTPRISAMLSLREKDFAYEMSILKSADAEGSACTRMHFSYPALPGVGHFIHTYVCDGNPLPSFEGEPERIAMPADLEAFTKEIWSALDASNRISLYTERIDLSGERSFRLINKNA